MVVCSAVSETVATSGGTSHQNRSCSGAMLLRAQRITCHSCGHNS